MEQLPPSLLVAALTITISFLSAAVGIIGYFLRDIKSSQKEKDSTQDKAIQDVKDDLADFKAMIPVKYVQRDDFIRVVAGLDAKIDKMYSEVGEINKNLNKLIGGKQ
ncbi:MAG: hypothetical protein K6T66_13860 [Peptococcaceae bacterium]|nr:hypothetical protein [Peptococcaceae bacterium]